MMMLAVILLLIVLTVAVASFLYVTELRLLRFYDGRVAKCCFNSENKFVWGNVVEILK